MAISGAMSRRSVYLRDQAGRCELHAQAQTASHTQAELRRIAPRDLERAPYLEAREAGKASADQPSPLQPFSPA